mmetsp:Transcript_22548/g.66464  ORF Transcript_22548/g.66464 Transcript_22548/m.66464 type:complete len:297 (-) Transcript_22548:342-1232(-)
MVHQQPHQLLRGERRLPHPPHADGDAVWRGLHRGGRHHGHLGDHAREPVHVQRLLGMLPRGRRGRERAQPGAVGQGAHLRELLLPLRPPRGARQAAPRRLDLARDLAAAQAGVLRPVARIRRDRPDGVAGQRQRDGRRLRYHRLHAALGPEPAGEPLGPVPRRVLARGRHRLQRQLPHLRALLGRGRDLHLRGLGRERDHARQHQRELLGQGPAHAAALDQALCEPLAGQPQQQRALRPGVLPGYEPGGGRHQRLLQQQLPAGHAVAERRPQGPPRRGRLLEGQGPVVPDLEGRRR